jgi:hypothetical protein
LAMGRSEEGATPVADHSESHPQLPLFQ